MLFDYLLIVSAYIIIAAAHSGTLNPRFAVSTDSNDGEHCWKAVSAKGAFVHLFYQLTVKHDHYSLWLRMQFIFSP